MSKNTVKRLRSKKMKIYGYKEKDVKGLMELIKNKGDRSLTAVFNEYAARSGKKQGTVRNLYYAMCKKSKADGEFRNGLSGSEALSVNEIKPFGEREECELVKNILLKKKNGSSVRAAIMSLTDDPKEQLRFQNKFRSVLRTKTELVKEILAEINAGEADLKSVTKEYYGVSVPEHSLKRLKQEINLLVRKIGEKTQRENAFLKEKISALELENMRLNALLYGENGVTREKSAADYFIKPNRGVNG